VSRTSRIVSLNALIERCHQPSVFAHVTEYPMAPHAENQKSVIEQLVLRPLASIVGRAALGWQRNHVVIGGIVRGRWRRGRVRPDGSSNSRPDHSERQPAATATSTSSSTAAVEELVFKRPPKSLLLQPVNVIEAIENAADGGLARSRWPHDRHRLAGGYGEADALEHDALGIIGEHHIFETNFSARYMKRLGIRSILKPSVRPRRPTVQCSD